MKNTDCWQIEWLVAGLAPWTISPHPNFSEKTTSAPAQLALVTEMRDLPRHSDPNRAPQEPAWAEEIVSCAKRSMQTDLQGKAATELVSLAGEGSIPIGARAVAAIYGTVALCEMELHSDAVSMLCNIVDELSDIYVSRDLYFPSQRIIISSLCLQLGARLLESHRLEEAQYYVNKTLDWLPAITDRRLEKFPTSRGISWGPSRVQSDLIRSIKNHALAQRSFLEQMGGDTWSRVVRARSSWVDMRMRLRSADRDELVLRDSFEQKVAASSRTQHLGRTTPEIAGYRSLILAELSGHLSFMYSEREKLGKALLIESQTESERIREALRLLRQGRSTKSLQSAIAWLRGQGPSDALVEDALMVTSRINRTHWCNEQDLLILEGASDFLNSQQRDDAITAAMWHPNTPQVSGNMSWSTWNRLWKTVTKLIPNSSRQIDVLNVAYDFLVKSPEVNQPVSITLARLVSKIDWENMPLTQSRQWASWAENATLSPDNGALVTEINNRIPGRAPAFPSEAGIEQVLFILRHGIPDNAPRNTLPKLTDHLIFKLQEEADQASRGSASLGGYQTLDIAIYFAFEFPQSELWDEIAAYILDPQINVITKDLGIDRIAYNAEKLPDNISKHLQEHLHEIVRSKIDKHFFSSSGSSAFVEAIRLSAALNALPKADILEMILSLTTSTVNDRSQAAQTIPFCLTTDDAIWGQALLLQLSHDADPQVRAAAASALVDATRLKSSLTDSINGRIMDLMDSDGIDVPLSVLHAFQRSLRSGNLEKLIIFKPNILKLSSHGFSEVTRSAALICLKLMAE